jgi:hypothetical protein
MQQHFFPVRNVPTLGISSFVSMPEGARSTGTADKEQQKPRLLACE